jgi:beta-N-acetylhexosaminidase
MRLDTALRTCVTAALSLAVAIAPNSSLAQRVTDTPGGASAARASTAWADSVLATLTPRERAAQMVWPNIYGDYVSDDSPQWRHITSYVTNEKVGGLLISIGSPMEIAVKLNALQRASTLPLLVGADFETGAGMRARGGYFTPNGIDLGGATVFPPNMAIGATNDSALAYEEGRITAREGRALGVHIDFAPVLDVNNNPANPVINTRSYGEDPRTVARLGSAFIRGLQDNGMIATAKHFPGHGDTGTNSHLALPVVNVSRARLDSVELVPFRAAVKSGVGAVMTFHGAMPALDASGVPGTLSPKVVTDLLRKQLRFNGLVISDAMDMRGVTDTYGATEAVKRAVAAGVDVLIQPADVTGAIDAVVAGVAEKRYPQSRVDDAVRRILIAKRQLGLDRERFVNLDSVRAIVGDSTNVAQAQRTADQSITIVRDSASLLPFSLTPASRVLSITVARRMDLAAGLTFNAALRRATPNVRAEFVMSDDPAANYPRLASMADSADVTIVSSYVGQSWDAVSASAPQAFADFVTRLSATGHKVVLVSFANPYLLQQIPSAPTYVVAWGGIPASQDAAARALLGTIPAPGKLPISIPPLVQRGR